MFLDVCIIQSLHERRDREGDIFIAIQKIQLFSTFYSVLLFSLHLAIVTKSLC